MYSTSSTVQSYTELVFFFHSSRIESPLLLAHANVLGMKHKAHYPVTDTQIKIFTASSGAQQVSIDNAFLGPIPERILIVLVKPLHSLALPVQIPSTFITMA